MGKKVFILNDGELDYKGNLEGGNVSLSYSDTDNWSSHVRGSEIGSITDDGDGIILKIGEIDLRLDYNKFAELYTLLDVKVKSDDNLMGDLTFLSETELNFIGKF